jgi:hypothetical protein
LTETSELQSTFPVKADREKTWSSWSRDCINRKDDSQHSQQQTFYRKRQELVTTRTAFWDEQKIMEIKRRKLARGTNNSHNKG